MLAMGIDVGTTNICVAVTDTEKKETICVKSDSNAFLPTDKLYERIQSPERILSIVNNLIEQATDEVGEPEVIGVTGQMHGIVYLNGNGVAVSPLYTWQDARGNEIYKDGKTYVQVLCEMGFSPIASGYGSATHFYNTLNGLVPEDTVKICTIHDYVAMTLCGSKSPIIHSSDAASLGLFDLKNFKFFDNAPFDTSVFGEVVNDCKIIGKTEKGIPVSVAIGDNQASFFGSVEDIEDSVLLNIGTGSQISVCSKYTKACAARGLELRPLNGDYCLLVGASLCGGRAFGILENFFRETLKMFDVDKGEKLYEYMQTQKPSAGTVLPEVLPLFAGTRENPDVRASVTGLDIDNFTPQNIIHAFCEGMVCELFDMYPGKGASALLPEQTLYGAGNGIRKNPLMREIIKRRFGSEPIRSTYIEEGAAGAAKFACEGLKKSERK